MKLQTLQKTYFLSAESDEEAQKWTKAISTVLPSTSSFFASLGLPTSSLSPSVSPHATPHTKTMQSATPTASPTTTSSRTPYMSIPQHLMDKKNNRSPQLSTSAPNIFHRTSSAPVAPSFNAPSFSSPQLSPSKQQQQVHSSSSVKYTEIPTRRNPDQPTAVLESPDSHYGRFPPHLGNNSLSISHDFSPREFTETNSSTVKNTSSPNIGETHYNAIPSIEQQQKCTQFVFSFIHSFITLHVVTVRQRYNTVTSAPPPVEHYGRIPSGSCPSYQLLINNT